MRRIIVYTSLASLLAAPVYAATAKRIDPFIKKAIQDSAQVEPEENEELIADPILPELDELSESASEEPQSLDAEDAFVAENDQESMPPLPELETEMYADGYEESSFETALDQEPIVIDEYEEQEQERGPVVLGYKLGSFKILPSLTLQGTYDDNIQASSTSETDDFFTTVQPTIEVKLEDSVHEMGATASYKGSFYNDNDDENTHDYHLKTDGKIKISEKAYMPFELGFIIDHEKREDDLTRQLPKEKTRTKDFVLGSGITYKTGKVEAGILGRYFRERFDDGVTPAGAQVIRRDADRATWEGTVKISYDYDETKTGYVSGTLANREYKRRNFESGGFNGAFRDGDFYELRAGLLASYDSFVTGDLSIAYKEWDHDDLSLSDVDDVIYRANIDVNFSEDTILGIDWNKDFYEDDEVINTIKMTDVRVALDHRFKEKFTVGTAVTYLERKFEQTDREDDTYGISLYGAYDINERFTFGLGYTADSRDSSGGSAFEYDRQQIMARITGRL
jgi:hypothetical protein